VSAVVGDLTRPGLGLDRPARAALEASVTAIVHCAAETRFGLPLETARAVNRDGTRRVLDLARRCRPLRQLVYVGTVYVAGRSAGAIAEAPARWPREGFCNTYQQSKHEAEALVVGAMGDLPAAIYRLSSIIGDARTGRVRQFNHVHQLVRLFPRSVVPIMPADPDAPVDLIPEDWAIPALARLVDDGFAAGDIAHLCASPEASLTVRELIDLTARAFERHPLGRQWHPIRVPRFVTVAEWEAYAERHRRGSDRLYGELLRVLGQFLPHLGIHQAFANHVAAKRLGPGGPALPPIRGYYERVVGHCLETAWGRRPEAAAVAIAAGAGS
jgi:long-chain acyl-CoA synthetase